MSPGDMWGFAWALQKVLIHNFWINDDLVMNFARLGAKSVSGLVQRTSICKFDLGDGRIRSVGLHEICRYFHYYSRKLNFIIFGFLDQKI